MAKITDEKLLQLLLVHGSVSETSVACGLSRGAIYKRLQDPDFRSRYNGMQSVLLSVTAGSMADAVGSAVQTLRSVLDNPEASPGVKVSAADALLRHGCKYIEMGNIMSRLEALEAIQEHEEYT